MQAAIDEAEQRLAEASHRVRAAAVRARASSRSSTRGQRAPVEVTLARLHESDAAMAALAEELGQLSSTARSAHGEADRLQQAIARAEEARDRDVAGLAELEHRLELAEEAPETEEPDPAERDRLAEPARLARSAEMDARLALRTLEERVRALAGRADALRRAAAHERQARAQARGPPRADAARGDGGRRPCTPAPDFLARLDRTSIALGGAERARRGRGADRRRGRAGRIARAGCGRWAAATSSPWSTPPTATRWPGPSSGCGWRR